jgi:hypothetical protein
VPEEKTELSGAGQKKTPTVDSSFILSRFFQGAWWAVSGGILKRGSTNLAIREYVLGKYNVTEAEILRKLGNQTDNAQQLIDTRNWWQVFRAMEGLNLTGYTTKRYGKRLEDLSFEALAQEAKVKVQEGRLSFLLHLGKMGVLGVLGVFGFEFIHRFFLRYIISPLMYYWGDNYRYDYTEYGKPAQEIADKLYIQSKDLPGQNLLRSVRQLLGAGAEVTTLRGWGRFILQRAGLFVVSTVIAGGFLAVVAWQPVLMTPVIAAMVGGAWYKWRPEAGTPERQKHNMRMRAVFGAVLLFAGAAFFGLSMQFMWFNPLLYMPSAWLAILNSYPILHAAIGIFSVHTLLSPLLAVFARNFWRHTRQAKADMLDEVTFGLPDISVNKVQVTKKSGSGTLLFALPAPAALAPETAEPQDEKLAPVMGFVDANGNYRAWHWTGDTVIAYLEAQKKKMDEGSPEMTAAKAAQIASFFDAALSHDKDVSAIGRRLLRDTPAHQKEQIRTLLDAIHAFAPPAATEDEGRKGPEEQTGTTAAKVNATPEEIASAERYWKGELKTTPIERPFRASRKEDVKDIDDITPDEALELEKIAVGSLANGEGNITVLAAGASSRMNTAEAPADVRKMVNNKELGSKAAVPLGRTTDGKVATYLGEFALNIARLLGNVASEAEQAGMNGDKAWENNVTLLSNNEYRPEHDELLKEHGYFGLKSGQIRFFHQPKGAKYVGTPADVKAQNENKVFKSEEDYRQALAYSEQAERDYKSGNREALIVPGEKDRDPLGHGEYFHQMIISGELLHMVDSGKKWGFVRNIDNAAAKFDKEWLKLLGYFLKSGSDFQPEVSIRSPGQRGGSLIVMADNGAHQLAEDPNINATIAAKIKERGLDAEKDKDEIAKITDDLKGSFWFNDAVAFYTPRYVINLYKQEGQTDKEFIEELRAANPAELQAIADRGRSRFPSILDPKPAKGIKAIAVKRETNMWQSTGLASPDIKIKAVGVRGARNVPIEEYKNMPFDEKKAILAQLRFLSTKQWNVSADAKEKARKDLEKAVGRPVTDDELVITLETYEGNKLLADDLLRYNREVELVTPGILQKPVKTELDKALEAGVKQVLGMTPAGLAVTAANEAVKLVNTGERQETISTEIPEKEESAVGAELQDSIRTLEEDLKLAEKERGAAKWEAQQKKVYDDIEKFLAGAEPIVEQAKAGKTNTDGALIEVLKGIQTVITLPQLSYATKGSEARAQELQKWVTDLWMALGQLQESGRLDSIKEAIKDEPNMNRMKSAHILIDKETGKAGIEDLPADKWSEYSADVWVPYLSRETLKKLIENTPLEFGADKTVSYPEKIGRVQVAELYTMAGAAGLAKADDRLNKLVDLENDVRKKPDMALSMMDKFGYDTTKLEDFNTFMNDFMNAISYLKKRENWASKGAGILEKDAALLQRVQAQLGLGNMSREVFAMRLVSLNIPFQVIGKVSAGAMVSGKNYRRAGARLIEMGRFRNVLMAGGTASRWKDSLGALLKKGIVDKNSVPDNLPRALAAAWLGTAKDGYTGPRLAFNNLAKSGKGKVAYFLSPYTWLQFMGDSWSEVARYGKDVEISNIAQNSSQAMELSDSKLTGKMIDGKVLGHGNVRGWVLGVLNGMKDGVVYDVTRSADNPFAQTNVVQFQDILGRMSDETLAHVAVGNWRNIGQFGGGFINVNGIPDVIDTAIPKTTKADGFNPNRDINVFSTMINIVNNAALLYAISDGITVEGEPLISWNEVQRISRGNQGGLNNVVARIGKLSAGQEAVLVRNFIALLPSEYVEKSENGQKWVQWEQISGMLHGALPKAIKERQNNEKVNWEKNLNMAYVDISLNDFKTLYGEDVTSKNAGEYLPMFVEVKAAPDLYSMLGLVGKLLGIMDERGIFDLGIEKPAAAPVTPAAPAPAAPKPATTVTAAAAASAESAAPEAPSIVNTVVNAVETGVATAVKIAVLSDSKVSEKKRDGKTDRKRVKRNIAKDPTGRKKKIEEKKKTDVTATVKGAARPAKEETRSKDEKPRITEKKEPVKLQVIEPGKREPVQMTADEEKVAATELRNEKLLEALPTRTGLDFLGFFGVAAGAAINGSFATKGKQGYYTPEGRKTFLEGVRRMREFFEPLTADEKIARLMYKPGIGGQHTPFAAIAAAFASLKNKPEGRDGKMVGLFELGENYEKLMAKQMKDLGIDMDQVAVFPSSKSGTTDETMRIFSILLYLKLQYVAREKGLNGEKLADIVFETLHAVNFDENGKERPAQELFRPAKGDLIDQIKNNVEREMGITISRETISDIFNGVLRTMFFETTMRPEKSRLASFLTNSGLDKALNEVYRKQGKVKGEEKVQNYVEMFDNIGGRWTGDIHMMMYLAYFGTEEDAERYWNLRRAGIDAVNNGDHPGVKWADKLVDEGVTDIALVLPKELFWFGRAMEQNFDESIWQTPGFATLKAFTEDEWAEAQKQYFRKTNDKQGQRKNMVIDLAGLKLKTDDYNVVEMNVRSIPDMTSSELFDQFADFFNTFYGMTSRVGDRLIVKALAAEGYRVSDINLKEFKNKATKIFQKNLYLLQEYVELGKHEVQEIFEELQAKRAKNPNAIMEYYEDRLKEAKAGTLTAGNLDGVQMPADAANMENLALAIKNAMDFAKRENRTFVPFIYLEGDRFLALRKELIKLGIEWVLAGTSDQHISYQQVLAQPQKFLPFFVSFLPELKDNPELIREVKDDKETYRMRAFLIAIGFTKDYLDHIPSHVLRDAFAQASFSALVEQRKAAGGKGVFVI